MAKKKSRKKPVATSVMIVPPFEPGAAAVQDVTNDAIEWAIEGGLVLPLSASIEVRDYGFEIQVTEISGRQRCANARYTREGVRSMYERTK